MDNEDGDLAQLPLLSQEAGTANKRRGNLLAGAGVLLLASAVVVAVVAVDGTGRSDELPFNPANVDATYVIDLSDEAAFAQGKRFDGIGGISGGGATSRLLIEYPQEVQDEILDLMFLPNFGASLHMFKVEIGGDSQSTDGSETSHMHSADDLDLTRGYEWRLMKEAKKRNPKIKLYGLPWAFPAWLSDDKTQPFKDPVRAANYSLQWMLGARDIHGLHIDYLGIWNERSPSAAYTKELRRTLDANGFNETLIVSNDGWGSKAFCQALANDPERARAVGVLGFHYPSDGDAEQYKRCGKELSKPVWSSEESSSYDDLNGAACWARIINSHYVRSGMTANLMWNLVGSYMHGTNWYASSMLTAVQPWSGYYEYEQMPVVWATAHYTQFTEPGWTMMPVGNGSGELVGHGTYVTFVSPCRKYFAVVVVKISHDHAPCTRPAIAAYDTKPEASSFEFTLPKVAQQALDDAGGQLAVWYSNFEAEESVLFERAPAWAVRHQGSNSVTLNLTLGSTFTVTNQLVGKKGVPKQRREPNASFPLPYEDDFSKYTCTGCYARYLSDQQGAFEVQRGSAGTALRQMTPAPPITWASWGRGPITVVGMLEWEDVAIEATFRIPSLSPNNTAPCVVTRTDQNWNSGISLCISRSEWYLFYSGPVSGVWPPTQSVIASGALETAENDWHTVRLETNGNTANGAIDGKQLFRGKALRSRENGFAGIGASDYSAVEFGRIRVDPVGPRWTSAPALPASSWSAGSKVIAKPCVANGLSSSEQQFDLQANWQIRHRASGLCVAPSGASTSADLVLAKCSHADERQKFRNDYTNIRNRNMPLKHASGSLCGRSVGETAQVELLAAKPGGGWCTWVYFPNTFQLRHKMGYGAGGETMCLHAQVTGARGSGK